MIHGPGGLAALAFVAFLVFVVAGAVWLAVTVQHADPAVTRRNAGITALVGGAVLIAVLVAQAFLFHARPVRTGPGFFQQPPGNIAPLRPRGPGQPQQSPQAPTSPRP